MSWRLLLSSAFAVSLCAAATAEPAVSKSVVIQFRTPTGNIGCSFSAGLDGAETPTVRCDIRSRLRPEPKPPKSCPLDYGDSIQVERLGRPVLVCHGDTAIDPHSRVLGYGTQWRRNGITCTSRAIGLTCVNRSGHGFFVSRQSWRLF